MDLKEPTLLVIRRSNYPVVNVKVQLTTAGTAVQYTISLTRRKGADVIEQQGTFAFGVVDGEVGFVGDVLHTSEDVAKIFLEPFFEF